ncbi:hypothetical protein A7U60_g1552 [Sanghuangporus baumii]|uniref:Uncharacterized protein n=1 Tax=Sanghuangporus baumii TaxID=108892 RepID=A0A9Q5I4E8_SANBA|nr:hypothetical protein A7U60_g1552 [Sanghuangporus baumii]
MLCYTPKLESLWLVFSGNEAHHSSNIESTFGTRFQRKRTFTKEPNIATKFQMLTKWTEQTPVLRSPAFASGTSLFSAGSEAQRFSVRCVAFYQSIWQYLSPPNYGNNRTVGMRIKWLYGHPEDASTATYRTFSTGLSIALKLALSPSLQSNMSNPSLTHTNPYIQGGWDPENSWPNDGSFDPSSPRSSSWIPAQSAYGVLPLGATPGALPPGLLGRHFTFRFMSNGNQTNLAFVGPNHRACYRIRTDNTHSYISVPQGHLARVSWTGAEPVMERGGRTIRASEFLLETGDAHGRRIKIMRANGEDFAWTYDKKAFYVSSHTSSACNNQVTRPPPLSQIHPANDLNKTIGTVYNAHGVELRILPDGLTTELLNCIVLAIVMMQGKMFVGLNR